MPLCGYASNEAKDYEIVIGVKKGAKIVSSFWNELDVVEGAQTPWPTLEKIFGELYSKAKEEVEDLKGDKQ